MRYDLKATRSFGTNGNGNVSLLRLSRASFIAYPNNNCIHILTDHYKKINYQSYIYIKI